MSGYVDAFSKKLTALIVLNQFLSIDYNFWSVKTCSKSLLDQHSRSNMIVIAASVYFTEKFDAIILGDTFHNYFLLCIFVHEFPIDQ
jgi:hypothetical protein